MLFTVRFAVNLTIYCTKRKGNCASPLSFLSHAWKLELGNLCLAALKWFPLTRLIEWPFIHRGGSWCCTVQMLITQTTLANWQSSIHCLLCECVPSKSHGCAWSHLLMWECTQGVPTDPALQSSPHLTSLILPPPHVNGQRWHTRPLWCCSWAGHCGLLTRSHPGSLHHHVNVQWECSTLNNGVLFTLTTRLTSLDWLFDQPNPKKGVVNNVVPASNAL